MLSVRSDVSLLVLAGLTEALCVDLLRAKSGFCDVSAEAFPETLQTVLGLKSSDRKL